MADEAKGRPLGGAVGRARRFSAASVAAVIALMLAAGPTRADDAQQQVIQKMQEQIQELQKKLDDLVAAQKATDAAVDSPNCIAIDEAENRLHVQKAIMAALINQ